RRAGQRDPRLHPAPLPGRLPGRQDGLRGRAGLVPVPDHPRLHDRPAPDGQVLGLLRGRGADPAGGWLAMATMHAAGAGFWRRRATAARVAKLIAYGSLTLVGAIYAVPFIWMILTSLKYPWDIERIPPTWLPAE